MAIRKGAIAGRRAVLQSVPLVWLGLHSSRASADDSTAPAQLRFDLKPDQSKYDPSDENLRDAAGMLQSALNAQNVQVAS